MKGAVCGVFFHYLCIFQVLGVGIVTVLRVQDVRAAKKKHQDSSELRPSQEAWLRGALGLGGSVTTLDQSGERLCDPDVPGARSGEEQAGATRAAKRGGG